MSSMHTIQAQVQGLGQTIDSVDCALGRHILSAKRAVLLEDLRRAQASHIRRNIIGVRYRG